MLFSPPNEFGKQFFYRLIGYSCAIHLGALVLFFGIETWLNRRPILVSLSGGCPVSMLPARAPSKRTQSRTASKNRQRRKAPSKRTAKKPQKKAPVKKAQPKKQAKAVPKKPLKKVSAKEVPPKNQIAKKAQPKKQVAKKEAPKKIPPKKETKKVPPKQQKGAPRKDVQKQPKKVSQPKADKEIAQGAVSSEPQEFHVAKVAVSNDLMAQEVAKYLSLPAGFEDFEAFPMIFDSKGGKVVNIRPHEKGPLVIYTAVKDALLKARMPKRDRTYITWLITP